jgi:hypothetical protein
MDATYRIQCNGDYIEVASDGVKTIDYARRMFTEVKTTAESSGCFKVLGVSNSTRPFSIADAYDHAEMFRDVGIDNRYRIAWVEMNDQAKDTLAFIEDVLHNRGLPGRRFETVGDARRWLMSKDP